MVLKKWRKPFLCVAMLCMMFLAVLFVPPQKAVGKYVMHHTEEAKIQNPPERMELYYKPQEDHTGQIQLQISGMKAGSEFCGQEGRCLRLLETLLLFQVCCMVWCMTNCQIDSGTKRLRYYLQYIHRRDGKKKYLL